MIKVANALKKIKGNTYYIDSAVNIGVIVNSKKKAIIVDTGLDDNMGRKILRILKEEGLTPLAIINTHSHADHCGGNNFIKKRFDIPTYASAFEKAIIENPLLEPFYLYSAKPLTALENKFLMAKESRVEFTIEEGEIEIAGIILNILSLKGHSPAMIGIATPDNIIFSGDAFFSTKILDKYPLSYYTDIKNTIKTLLYLKTLKYDYFLPSHGELLKSPLSTIDAGLRQIKEIGNNIIEFCIRPKSREEILAHIVEAYEIKLNIQQYYLTSSTISAYLSYLTDEGTLETKILENNLKWVKA